MWWKKWNWGVGQGSASPENTQRGGTPNLHTPRPKNPDVGRRKSPGEKKNGFKGGTDMKKLLGGR